MLIKYYFCFVFIVFFVILLGIYFFISKEIELGNIDWGRGIYVGLYDIKYFFSSWWIRRLEEVERGFVAFCDGSILGLFFRFFGGGEFF